MMDIQKQIEQLQENARELTEVREDVFNVKSDLTITAVGILLGKLNDYINDMVEISAKKEYYDKDLSATLKTIITEVIDAFSKIKSPEVIFKPNINVDFKPLQNTLSDISKTHETIISLMNKYNSSNGNGQTSELFKLITGMIDRTEKQNDFIKKWFESDENTKALQSISAGVNKKATEWVATATKFRDDGGIRELTIKVTK